MAYLLAHFYSLQICNILLHVQLVVYSVPSDDIMLNAKDGMWSLLIGCYTIMYVHIIYVRLKKRIVLMST